MCAQPAMQHSVLSATIADVLERVLDKGLVIAGDIKIKLVDIELLTIQIRLVVCSVAKAQEIGLDWWRQAPPEALPHSTPATWTTSQVPPGPIARIGLGLNRLTRATSLRKQPGVLPVQRRVASRYATDSGAE